MYKLISSMGKVYLYKDKKLIREEEGSFWKINEENYISENKSKNRAFKNTILDFSHNYFLVDENVSKVYEENEEEAFYIDKNILALDKICTNIYADQGDLRFKDGNLLIVKKDEIYILDEKKEKVYSLKAQDLKVDSFKKAHFIQRGNFGESHLLIVAEKNLSLVLEVSPITKEILMEINYKNANLIGDINDFLFKNCKRADAKRIGSDTFLVLNDFGLIYKFNKDKHLTDFLFLKDPIDYCYFSEKEINLDFGKPVWQYLKLYGNLQEKQAAGKAKKINDSGSTILNYKNFYSHKKDCLIIFGSQNCIHCEGALEIIKDAHKEMNFVSYYMDLTNESLIREKFKIRAYPTSIIFKGGKEFKRFTGKINYDDLLDALEEVW